MKDWKKVTVPANMQHLKTDTRGYPIPHIVLRDNKGKPHFTINDSEKINECLANNVCSICGKELGDDTWLAGGPLSAFHPHGAYIDAPTHHDCGYYAFQVCPYLAAAKYNHRIDAATLDPADFNGATFVDPSMIPERPVFFVYAKVSGFIVQPVTRYIIPNRPFLQMEFWQHGQMISKEHAVNLFNQQYGAK